MPEIIVHTAISEDIVRLSAACSDVHPLTRGGLEGDMELMTLGSSTRFADKHSVGLLTRIRDDAGTSEAMRDRLTFVLGWITHRAADRQMKPVFRENPDPEGKRPTLCSVYQEAFVFTHLMKPQEREPYFDEMWRLPLPVDPAEESAGNSSQNNVEQAAAELQRIVTMMLQRALLSFHTLIPDDTDIEPWLDAIAGLVQNRRNNLHRYIDAILRPDPALVKKYIHDINFYDEHDPIIATAREVQFNGRKLTIAEIKDLSGGSHYARAMQSGLAYVLAADAFLSGKIGSDELEKKLDIGNLGRDGRVV